MSEALRALSAGSLTIAAGCTDLLPATERKSLTGAVLDISAIAELRGITQGASGVTIGATTTWSDIVQADLPAAFDGLKAAAREVGARQIQNRGTIGGNLCNASPAADGVPPLLTLDAEIEVSSVRGARRLPLAEFLQGPRQTARAADELLTAIHISWNSLVGQGAFVKLGAREYLVISIVMAAARVHVEHGIIQNVALSVGSCGPVATRLTEVETALIGQPADAAHISPKHLRAALSPIDDIRADAVYRSDAAVELVQRAVDKAIAPRKRAA